MNKLNRRNFIALAPLALGGCNWSSIQASINTDATKLRQIAAAIDAAVAKGDAAIVAAAPQIAADIQTVCNVCIAVNNLTQAAVNLGQISPNKAAVKTLAALAASPIVQSEANGTLTGQNPLTIATGVLQAVAAVKAANSKITAVAAVSAPTAGS